MHDYTFLRMMYPVDLFAYVDVQDQIEELEMFFEKANGITMFEDGLRIYNGDMDPELIEKYGYVGREFALRMIVKAACDGYVPAMYFMADLCRESKNDGFETKDRTHEHFWYEKTYSNLDDAELLNHARNMADGSYEMDFSREKIDSVLEMSAALGNNEAKMILADRFSDDLENKEDLKKSLYWFYTADELSPEMQDRLKAAEKALGIK